MSSQSREFPQADLGVIVEIIERTAPPNVGDAVYEGVKLLFEPEGTEEEQAALLLALHNEGAVRAAAIMDAAGRLPRIYDPEAPDHLRIYGVPHTPSDLVGRYLAHRPPTEFPWNTLDTDKEHLLDLVPADGVPGDIPEKRYSIDGVPIARRVFSFAYSEDEIGADVLTVTITPGWARNDGSWVDGLPRIKTITGEQYNDWRDEARARIFKLLKTYLPRVLVALGVVASVTAGEASTRSWFAAKHAPEWSAYMSSGDKSYILFSLTEAQDDTAWLDLVVPDGIVPGLASGTTVRDMVRGSLR